MNVISAFSTNVEYYELSLSSDTEKLLDANLFISEIQGCKIHFGTNIFINIIEIEPRSVLFKTETLQLPVHNKFIVIIG